MSNWSKRRVICAPLFAVVVGSLLSIGPVFADDGKITAGWIERVLIIPEGLDMEAKLDTGADNSSLNATRIRIFKRRGKNWVAFRVTNRAGKSLDLERPVVRIARIKNLDGMSLRRPTILLGICLGPVFREVQVNLAERKGFKFSVLVGRSFMAGRILVDPSRKYVTDPSCPEIRTR